MQSGSLFNLNTFINPGIWRAVSTRKGWPCNSLDTLIGQGNFGFCCSSPFSTRTCVPLIGSNCHFSNRSSCSAVQAVSHSGPIVPGYTRPAFEYTDHPSYRRIMAASSSKATSGEVVVDSLISNCGNVTTFAKPTGVFFSDRSPRIFPRVSMSVKIREPNDKDLNGNIIFGNTWKSPIFYPRLERCVRSYNTSSSPCYSGGAALDGSSSDEQVVSLAISADQKLELVSGSCYLPHPDKEETGGEDAHFICTNEQVIGVADGVGGWADVGVNAGEYSRQLMSNSVTAVQNEPTGCIDPARVLEKAHSSTKAMGSSTACIIALTDQGIHAINLGDSGFIVVRDGCTYFQSPVQQHGFNFTYQLENNSRGDPPSSGQIFTIAVAPGDVIVAGSDGLFDNLYNNEITSIVAHAVRAGLSPEATAQKIAALARERAQDRSRQTPFSAAAQEAGFRYYGGKLDDITVVVSFVTSSADT